MMKISQPRLSRLYAIAGSTGFFWFIVGVFVFQAVWLAATANYPMAFDEDFHFGLIKIYAHHISPFWSGQPAGADIFGALTRDPSYLYQYLMSFPYRLINLFTHRETIQVLFLRAINIGLFAWALVLYRRLLSKTRASQALINLSLLIFVLIPIVPYLGAQINYDNLMIPLTALALILTVRLRHSMKAGIFNTHAMLYLYSVLLAASLVKYAFLPILLAITGYLLYEAYKFYGTPSALIEAIRIGGRRISRPALIGLMALGLVTTVLFVERYAVNIVKYHAPVADCGQVLDYSHCKDYGPWIRDYNLEQNKGDPSLSLLAFNNDWFKGMWYRSFFGISGVKNDFANSGPLTYPAVGTIVFAGVGAAAFLVTAKKLWRRYYAPAMWLLLTVSLVYVVVLWLDNYQMYNQTGIAVAINGRYLLPVIPIVVLMTALGVNEVLGPRRWLKAALASVVILSYLWGGGFLTYVLRSNDSWYWPGTPLKGANEFIIRDIGPYVPGFRHPLQYMP
jgi:hypothetical protein